MHFRLVLSLFPLWTGPSNGAGCITAICSIEHVHQAASRSVQTLLSSDQFCSPQRATRILTKALHKKGNDESQDLLCLPGLRPNGYRRREGDRGGDDEEENDFAFLSLCQLKLLLLHHSPPSRTERFIAAFISGQRRGWKGSNLLTNNSLIKHL